LSSYREQQMSQPQSTDGCNCSHHWAVQSSHASHSIWRAVIDDALWRVWGQANLKEHGQICTSVGPCKCYIHLHGDSAGPVGVLLSPSPDRPLAPMIERIQQDSLMYTFMPACATKSRRCAVISRATSSGASAPLQLPRRWSLKTAS